MSSTVSSLVALIFCTAGKHGKPSVMDKTTMAPRCTTGVPGPILSRISSLKGPGGGKEPNLQGRLGDPARCWGPPNQQAMCASPEATSKAICSSNSIGTVAYVASTRSPCAFCNPTNCNKGLTCCATAVSRSWFFRSKNSEMIFLSEETMWHFFAFSFWADASASSWISWIEDTEHVSKRMSPPRLWTVTETSKLSDLSIVSDPDIDTYRYRRIDVESMSNRCRINVWYERGKAKQNNTEEL